MLDQIEDAHFCVYMLLDPSKNDEPFYVGKGRRWRPLNHYSPGYLKKASHKSHIILRYRELGFEDKFKVVADGLTEVAAFELEMAEIARLGRRCDGGLLVNRSFGGEGASGFAAPRTPEWNAKIAASNTGKKLTASHVAKLRRAKLGATVTAKHRLKISMSLRGRPKSEAHRIAAGLALRGRKLSAEHKEICLRNLKRDEGKWHRVVSPLGEVFFIRSLRAFCAGRGLSNVHLGQVALGRRKHHKGWTAEFIYFPDEGSG